MWYKIGEDKRIQANNSIDVLHGLMGKWVDKKKPFYIETYMKNVAYRMVIQNGKQIRHETPEAFIFDLIQSNMITPVGEK